MKSRLTHAVSVIMFVIVIGWVYLLVEMQAGKDPEFHNALTPFSVFAVAALGGFFKWSEGQKPDSK